MPLLGSMGGVLWGSQIKTRLVNSNFKSRVLVSSMGILSKGKVLGVQETIYYKGLCGNHINSLHLLVTCGLLRRAWACMRGKGEVKAPSGCLSK